jgi:hypothetical protein
LAGPKHGYLLCPTVPQRQPMQVFLPWVWLCYNGLFLLQN